MIDFDISDLKFDAHGLIPAIVVDATTKDVLTLAYMNRESLQMSMEKELTTFWSRSRQQLWLKGETSGKAPPATWAPIPASPIQSSRAKTTTPSHWMPL